jgi:hypothetical protein
MPTAHSLSIVPTPVYGPGPTRRCTAINLLFRRGVALDNTLATEKTKWGKKLKDAIQELDDLCDPEKTPKPATAKGLSEHLDKIFAAKEKRDQIKRDRAKAEDEATVRCKANAQALVECQSTRAGGPQQNLPGVLNKLAEGLELTPGTLELIDAAAREVLSSAGSKNAPDIDDIRELAAAIAEMGIDGGRFVSATSDAVEMDDKEPEDMSAEAGDDPDSEVPF